MTTIRSAGLAAALLLLLIVAGCAPDRLVVVDPAKVGELTSTDWNVKSTPASTPSPQ